MACHTHVQPDQLSMWFAGTIPSNFIALGNGRIKSIHLNNNQLTGSVPVGWNPLDMLTSFSAHNNNLTVPVDASVCEMSVYAQGVMVEMRVDCEICTCDMLCAQCQE